jgi:hypothetical protein
MESQVKAKAAEFEVEKAEAHVILARAAKVEADRTANDILALHGYRLWRFGKQKLAIEEAEMRLLGRSYTTEPGKSDNEVLFISKLQ